MEILATTSSTLKWRDARTTCQNLGGDLAIIRSQDENNFMRDLVMNQQTIQGWGAWLVLTRKTNNWTDDTPLASQYSSNSINESVSTHLTSYRDKESGTTTDTVWVGIRVPVVLYAMT